MKPRHVLSFLSLSLVLVAGCELPLAPHAQEETITSQRRGGKQPKPEPEPEPDPAPDPQSATFELVVPDAFDPLWRFTITGAQVLLQTDPSVTSWGTDYWGYWSDPYPYVDGIVEYTIGLTHTTYVFVELADGRIDVTKTLVVQPYLSGSPTTTVTHVGVFGPAG